MRRWSSWALVSLLAVLCCVVAILQYRWIGEISAVERTRLQDRLRDGLNSLRNTFGDEIRTDFSALQATGPEVERLGREEAYSERYLRWKSNGKPIFRRIALAVLRDGVIELEDLDPVTGRFTPAPWPPDWADLHERLAERLQDRPGPPVTSRNAILEMPRFGHGPGEHEQEWLLAALNIDYVRSVLLPGLLDRYLGESGRLPFDAAVLSNSGPVFESSAGAWKRIGSKGDASVMLDSGGPPEPGGFRGTHSGGGPPGPPRGDHPGPPGGRGPRPMMGGGLGWTLQVRHHAGSLEALVEHARRRNLALSGGLLLLIVAAVAALVRFSRQAQRLAELQIHFVAGVSHEVRTPLTVIRTAAYNLRGRMAERPEQVERYGLLIQEESKKLDALIEHVLRFASAKAGHVVRRREPVQVDELIDGVLDSSAAAARRAGVVVEKAIAPDLPAVLGDEVAMRHALQNLFDNALKYGAEGGNWVGVFAEAVPDGVEIRVADRGPGVPADEQAHIFEPFFRGRRAVNDQIHGTGLGLDLVKKIVTAHGGTVRVKSAAGKQTEFVMRIPAA
jgi:signal transduction histidine kinase